ncbi:hypothetical protein ACOTD3_27785 [Achromobacter dolens]|uniref:hypothetical protein n=1 Tax=Achromobacter dolens TaxID=1287738 RepID=UPI003BA38226
MPSIIMLTRPKSCMPRMLIDRPGFWRLTALATPGGVLDEFGGVAHRHAVHFFTRDDADGAGGLIDALVDIVAAHHNGRHRVHPRTRAGTVVDQLHVRSDSARGPAIAVADRTVSQQPGQAGLDVEAAFEGDTGVGRQIDVVHVQVNASLTRECQHGLRHRLSRDVENERPLTFIVLPIGGLRHARGTLLGLRHGHARQRQRARGQHPTHNTERHLSSLHFRLWLPLMQTRIITINV